MFQVPKAAEPFRFAVGDDVYSIPTIQSLPLPVALEIREQTASKTGTELQDALLAIMVRLFDRYAEGVTSRLTMEQFTALVSAYLGDGEALGESSGSSD